jgi:cobaltochelatase CobN
MLQLAAGLRRLRLLPAMLATLLCAALLQAQPVPTQTQAATAATETASAAASTLRISYLFSDGNMSGTLAAWRALLQERPELAEQVQLQFLTESFFDSVDVAALQQSDVLLLDMMNQQMLERFDSTYGLDLLQSVQRNGGKVVVVGVGLQPTEYFTERGAVWNERAQAYWQNGGVENQQALLQFALDQAGVPGLQLPEPKPGLDFGYYYPGPDGGQVFADWDSFEAWRSAKGKTAEGRVQVAIGFYRDAYYGSETGIIDALVAQIEASGAAAIPFFGYPDALAFERLLLDDAGESRAAVALALLLRFADFDAAQSLAKLDIPILNMITLYGRSEQEWRESDQGLSLFEGTFQVAVPELAGTIAPTVIGSREQLRDPVTGLTLVVNSPIPDRIELAVQRALRLARLQSRPNADKQLALMYYSYPAGKANIGATYLNIEESLSLILMRLRDEGYDTGDAALDPASILQDITGKARNVGSFAPGELDELLAAGSAALVDMPTYRQWLDALEPGLRDKLLADWGAPEDSELMATGSGADKAFVIPQLRYGNIVLLPQPARGWGANLEQLYHADNLAPPHQYLAVYGWLRHVADVDAVVHMGTHGTLEWLDGKDMGLDGNDASDALIADLPNLYIYNVDVVGEGLVARRRGMATLLDHMVPSFIESELYPELARLMESINNFDSNIHKNPELATAFAGDIIEQVVQHGIDTALGLQFEAGVTTLDHEQVHDIQDYLVELRAQFIPYGLHAFGRLPTEEMRRSTVDAIVAVDRSLLPDEKAVLAADMEQRIIQSASAELDNFVRAARGGYIPGGSGGEPIRNPDAYPTGKNFYGIDPEKVPRKAAWELGVKLADDMIAQHLAEHGEYPRKISFVIWGDETMRHEGVLESQIFHLLGTRPVWDARDKVVGVEVVPSRELGRPRIDILIASAAEGMFNNVTVLMDEAVQKVKVLEEAENFVRDHYLATKASLMRMGYSEDDADRRAGVRIFDEPPGVYNLNTSTIAAASGSWDSDIGMANDYINKMGHGFGNGFWGEPMQDVFKLALDGVQKVVHSSSTMLYGALDNDDFYMYMGGLAASVRSVGGAEPELLVTNTRDPGKPGMESLDRFIATEFRSRYVNPVWIEGMQAEGYAGARAMVEFIEYMWGWDATVTQVVDERMWQEAFEVYVQDKHALGMQDFFESQSPYAFQDLAARMLETVRKQYWDADEAVTAELLQRYVASVNEFGINCTELSCGNARLMDYVLQEGAKAGLSGVDLAAFRAAVENAVRGNIEELARELESFARDNEARIAAAFAPRPAPALQGFRMQPIEQPQPAAPQSVAGPSDQRAALLMQLLLLAAALLWWQRRRLSLTRS